MWILIPLAALAYMMSELRRQEAQRGQVSSQVAGALPEAGTRVVGRVRLALQLPTMTSEAMNELERWARRNPNVESFVTSQERRLGGRTTADVVVRLSGKRALRVGEPLTVGPSSSPVPAMLLGFSTL